MIRSIVVIAAVGAVVSAASASVFQYSFSADLAILGTADVDMLDGATITLSGDFDGSGGWGSLFGTPALTANAGTSMFSISGSGNAANNTSGLLDEDLYYSATGVSSMDVGGLSDLFLSSIAGTLGSGSGFTVQAFYDAGASAIGTLVGDSVEASDFTTGPVTIFGTGSVLTASGTRYELRNATATLIPAPGAAAMLGLAGVAGLRRRR